MTKQQWQYEDQERCADFLQMLCIHYVFSQYLFFSYRGWHCS